MCEIMDFTNTNLNDFIKNIIKCDNIDDILDKCKNQSLKGFVFERLWDLIIKFGFCPIFPNSQFCHKIGNSNNGKLKTVDIVSDSIEKSKIFYRDLFPNLDVEFFCGDSVEYLKSYEGKPNLVHLDSWDLEIPNPLSSMLHGWLEFSIIKDKMPSGSICIIDDNYLNGTTVYWNILNNGNHVKTLPIDITYDIVGKGSLVYHWVKNYDTDWELIGNHYQAGPNIKLILKKK